VCAGLAYLTQQCEPIARLDVKLGRLARRLGEPDPDTPREPPPKPPRMHWRTYDRLADVFGDARHARTAYYLDGKTRLLDWYDPTWRERHDAGEDG